eukprot:6669389-Pyramimonas_sp.AAC.1
MALDPRAASRASKIIRGERRAIAGGVPTRRHGERAPLRDPGKSGSSFLRKTPKLAALGRARRGVPATRAGRPGG